MFLPVTGTGVPYRDGVSQPTAPRPPLRLTRRGRLVRSALALLLAVLLILALVAVVRALGGRDAPEDAAGGSSASAAASPAPSSDEATDSAEEPSPSPTPVAEGDQNTDAEESAELVRSGTVGDGTWTIAAPAAAPAEAEGVVHTYAVRVEDGAGIDADEASAEIAAVLADPRGWQEIEDVTFQQVAALEDADLTISLASPPTVDDLCLPARTGGCGAAVWGRTWL